MVVLRKGQRDGSIGVGAGARLRIRDGHHRTAIRRCNASATGHVLIEGYAPRRALHPGFHDPRKRLPVD
jgi:hypothetical protein